MRKELDDSHVDRLRTAWADALDGRVDLCVYWHEAARRSIACGKSARAGLLATQNIRGTYSRPVLKRITETGQIFLAYSDDSWVNNGAAVNISIVCQDDGSESEHELDGVAVARIGATLSAGVDLSGAAALAENSNIAFQGVILTGDFDVAAALGEQMRAAPINVNGKPNTDVVLPFVSAHDLANRPAERYVIDFGIDTPMAVAAQYERPFEHLREHVYPYRTNHERLSIREHWWLHESPRSEMRRAVQGLRRWMATPLTAKHRYFVWLQPPTIPQSTIVVLALSDDYSFGVLHSRAHSAWALARSSRLADGDNRRYVHTQCFNTFPFPWPLDTPDGALTEAQVDHRDAIAAAAVSLNEQREAWLNPPNADPDELRQRTMTNLYNDPPVWLQIAHREIDEAVSAAYGWPTDLSEEEILSRLLALNLDRASV